MTEFLRGNKPGIFIYLSVKACVPLFSYAGEFGLVLPWMLDLRNKMYFSSVGLRRGNFATLKLFFLVNKFFRRMKEIHCRR